MLTVIVPAYNEAQNIPLVADTLERILDNENIPYEILFVDDGSTDGTWEAIQEASQASGHSAHDSCAKEDGDRANEIGIVRGICFSRNFGKESAIFAGLKEAQGDCAVVIDADLQHPPEKIIEMYRLWEDGYEIVEGVKRSRGNESGAHSFAARCFYGIMSSATGTDMSKFSDFKLLDRKALNALINMPEKNTFFRALSNWVGFKSIEIEYDVNDRTHGESKWSIRDLTRYAIRNITSFTSAPMHIVTILGVVLMIVTIMLTAIALYQKIAGIALQGFTTVIILQCFTGSATMISLGIIGYYISKIYEEVKGRPRYIISKKTHGH